MVNEEDTLALEEFPDCFSSFSLNLRDIKTIRDVCLFVCAGYKIGPMDRLEKDKIHRIHFIHRGAIFKTELLQVLQNTGAIIIKLLKSLLRSC